MALSKDTRRRLLHELLLAPLRAQRPRLIGIVTALVFVGVSTSLLLLASGSFVKALFLAPGQEALRVADLVPKQAHAYLGEWGDMAVNYSLLVVLVPCVMMAAGLCRAFANYLFQLHQQALALYLAKNYRDKLFQALLSRPYVDIKKRQVGEWMSLVMNDVMLLQSRYTEIVQALVQGGVTIIACIGVLAFLHWPTALIIILVSPFISFGMGRTGKRIARYAEAFQREMARIAGMILDFRARFDFIRAQRGEEREKARFASLNLAYFRMIRKSILVRSAFSPALDFFGFSVFAVAVYAIGKGYWGDFTPQLMMQFFVALGLMLRPLREMGEQLSRFHESRGTLLNSLALFENEVLRFAQDDVILSKAKDLDTFPGLTIHSIKAGMAGEARFVAESLRVQGGRSIAIIGPSGAGKSTLLKTLAGLVEPLEWRADLPWREASHLVSMVSQDPFLFDDSIDANLSYGLDPVALPDEDSVWRALSTVNIDREVKGLPSGLATRLRAIGSNVSGGQLQRLVIARGLLRSKPIWLLDEATSAVDAKSEKDITQRLIAACKASGQALLAVTHRLTWLESFDEVWFIENGRLALAGPHATLLREARYREFCAAAKGTTDA